MRTLAHSSPGWEPIFFDSHCHLNDEAFAVDAREVILRAQTAGVGEMLVAGYDLSSSQQALKLAADHQGVYAAVGVHPHDAKTVTPAILREIEKMLDQEKVVALGEIGLDFHYDYSPREVQKAVFRSFLELAQKKDKPVIIHDREAHGDTLAILEEVAALRGGGFRGVMHCYAASPEMLPSFLALGFYISVAGPLTFKNAKKLPEVVSLVPEDRLLIETDAPYLTPCPYRGRRNEPIYVKEVAHRVAEIWGKSIREVAEVTRNNARRCFRIN
ncbi:MAG TPA: TatD family hydrolase [Bacillota bacterium]